MKNIKVINKLICDLMTSHANMGCVDENTIMQLDKLLELESEIDSSVIIELAKINAYMISDLKAICKEHHSLNHIKQVEMINNTIINAVC